jgi:precorrin-2 dehydrogenase/sirohydrochlorin ferrochelatase
MPERKPTTYPINLRLADLPVLVVGAGRVGLRKVRGLLDAGARVTVVAPEAVPELKDLANEGRIELECRAYRRGEVKDYRLVFVATGHPGLAREVSADATACGLFVNVADVPDLCGFYLPAVIKRGPLQLALNTDGTAPFVSRRLRKRLEDQFPPALGEWVACAGAFRRAVLAAVQEPRLRDALFDRFILETLPDFPAVVTDPILPAPDVWRGWIEEAVGG